MSRRTKKIGSAGRFGPRYGMKIRLAVSDIEKTQKLRHACPSCGKNAVRRLASGIWTCRSCDSVFAGGAYTPTSATKLATRAEGAVFKKKVETLKPSVKRDKFKGKEPYKPKPKGKKEEDSEKVKKGRGK